VTAAVEDLADEFPSIDAAELVGEMTPARLGGPVSPEQTREAARSEANLKPPSLRKTSSP